MTYSSDENHSTKALTGKLIIILWVICLFLFTPHVIADECDFLDRDNYPPGWKLPATAIDTDSLPDITIDLASPVARPLPVYQLADNTYMFFGNISILSEKNRGFNANAGFIVTEQGVIVIDSLGTPRLGQRMISTIRCITNRPVKYLIVTHNHPDHAYGAAAFMAIEGITIITHPGTIDYNHSATLESSVDYRRQVLSKDMEDFKPLQADSYLTTEAFAKTRIRLGSEVIDIYNTGKHHSYGDLVVHQVNRKVLWIADLAFNQRTTFMGDGDSAQILKAQDWLLQTFPDTDLVVPGHGSAQRPPFPMIAKTHDYVIRMRNVMKKAVEDGDSMLDAVQAVEFKDWQHLPLYEMNQRANANFVYREMEQAYFDDFE
jgi:glyoxylase-like metal-dependent hydrolase (beta-lactamase superfamily II)